MSTARPDHAGIADSAHSDAYCTAFPDLHPPYSNHEATIEAARCYFCHDAPCIAACPTSIDIPLFIRQIAADNLAGSAKTIFDQNILGGTCARVCPTETLCEQACVRQDAEGNPVKIGRLQRHATDFLMARPGHPYDRAPSTGRRIAVVGAGPAGLACAHRLAMHGHDVKIFEARDKPGGLNEYGLAVYKTVDNFAQREVAYLMSIGGIELETGKILGRGLTLRQLCGDYDAVFLGIGLAGTNSLNIEGDDFANVLDAVDYIARLRQAYDVGDVPVGRQIAVIGGGMTAIDVAIQTRLLGAQEVTIFYRRGKDQMNASEYEQNLAQINGVKIRRWVRPLRILGDNDGKVRAVEFETTAHTDGKLSGTGNTFTVETDMVFKAIGQTLVGDMLNGSAEKIALHNGRIQVDENRRTSLGNIWAGGDCIAGGEDLTVTAVEDGKIAAESIHNMITGE
ncbi:MAG: NAD(P)-dependent oxidoreductase [Fimbriimonadaceae bacterium]|nr:NAD(P)-dependent oxidoreductase [Alphaproteobacteria bacterium]